MEGRSYAFRFIGSGEVSRFYDLFPVMYVIREELSAGERSFVDSLLEKRSFVNWSSVHLQDLPCIIR